MEKPQTKPVFYITHLYPENMNIYGDMGNIIAMKHKLRKIGLEPIYQSVAIGAELPSKTDWYFIGGGQDSEQIEVINDLLRHKKRIFQDVANGVGLLAICGGYQLLGKKFITGKDKVINGIGLFEVVTQAPTDNVKDRCVGNIVTNCLIEELKDNKLVGFENHSGQTTLLPSATDQGGFPLGSVVKGNGNNKTGLNEGYVLKNAVGTYLHGSCLPKNSFLTSWFINNQLLRKGLGSAKFTQDEISSAVNLYLQEK
jgi:lipid II isoglutaminyl synthase (glutamine-hydrolysing)